MKKAEKLLIKLQSEQFKNWSFSDFQLLLSHLGFRLDRIGGSHHIYIAPDQTILPVQPKKGEAIVYQLRQLRNWLDRQSE